MARRARIQYEHAFYYVMNRGRGRRWIYHGKAFYEAGFELTCFAVFVLECDFAVLIGDNGTFTDDPAIEIAGKVFQSVLTATSVPAMRHPFLWNANRQGSAGFVDGIEKLSPEHFG